MWPLHLFRRACSYTAQQRPVQFAGLQATALKNLEESLERLRSVLDDPVFHFKLIRDRRFRVNSEVRVEGISVYPTLNLETVKLKPRIKTVVAKVLS